MIILAAALGASAPDPFLELIASDFLWSLAVSLSSKCSTLSLVKVETHNLSYTGSFSSLHLKEAMGG